MINKDLRAEVRRFENIIKRAIQEKYASHPPEFRDNLSKFIPILKFDIEKFLDVYLEKGLYPEDRLEKLIYYAFDLKLQFYFLLEVDMGLYNKLVYPLGYDRKNPHSKPHLLLTRQSLDQSLIFKSRILWERIMNFVYFLENGEHIENKVSRKKSKRKVFFEFCSSNPKWQFLLDYEGCISQYEELFRSPESHKFSILRSELMGEKTLDSNDLLDLLNIALNVIWQNILKIISGQKPGLKFQIIKSK